MPTLIIRKSDDMVSQNKRNTNGSFRKQILPDYVSADLRFGSPEHSHMAAAIQQGTLKGVRLG